MLPKNNDKKNTSTYIPKCFFVIRIYQNKYFQKLPKNENAEN